MKALVLAISLLVPVMAQADPPATVKKVPARCMLILLRVDRIVGIRETADGAEILTRDTQPLPTSDSYALVKSSLVQALRDKSAWLEVRQK